MSARLINVEVRLPTSTIEELEAIAKLCGLKPEQVARVLVALYVRKNAAGEGA